ncbi:tetratricopeptide repeat protein [Cellvibrio japonicus]|nr:hypothetical protein [Cellvibrio japonicus]QEI11081.1 hypothetical protein FY117_01785 [Cellvibrio japonicus]QEI14655.1 hypothetical protein FY116_01785 [Cellvibrio japonicus]QEI18235.1 hypothetical protein FY115_01785 [Cellvibrio japonicus]
MMLPRLLPLILVALVTGCTSVVHEPAPTRDTQVYPQPDIQQPGPDPAVVVPTPKPEPVAPAINPAVESLLRQARTQYQSQNYQGAIATAERGLRIDRRSADLYLVLAQSYVQLALPQKAKMFVQQGLRYAQQGSDAAVGLMRVQEVVGN